MSSSDYESDHMFVKNYVLRLVKRSAPKDLETGIIQRVASELTDYLLKGIETDGSHSQEHFDRFTRKFKPYFSDASGVIWERFEETVFELFQIKTLIMLKKYLSRLDETFYESSSERSFGNSHSGGVLSDDIVDPNFDRNSNYQRVSSYSFRDSSIISQQNMSGIINNEPFGGNQGDNILGNTQRSSSRVASQPIRFDKDLPTFRSQSKINNKPLREYIIPFYYQGEGSLITDSDIRRNLAFTLSGSTSELFPFEADHIKLPDQISPGMSGLLYQLFEAALLFKYLSERVLLYQRTREMKSQVKVAFFSCVNEELKLYKMLINSVLGPESEDEPSTSIRSLYVSLMDSILKLRFMHFLNFQVEKLPINEFLSLIYTYTNMGDSLLQGLSETFFNVCINPYYYVLGGWLLKGEINPEESVNEGLFIVIDDEDFSNNSPSSSSYYSGVNDMEKYSKLIQSLKFDHTKVIKPLNKELSYLIYGIGKGLMFLNAVCKDLKWCISFHNKYQSSLQEALGERSIKKLENVVKTQYKELTRYLTIVLFDRYKLLDEIKYFHEFLLTKKGDLINALIINGRKIFNDPASRLSPYALNTILQESIENSSVRYYPKDCVDKLDARMLEMGEGSIGWDVFTLAYDVPSGPLSIVFSGSRKEYLKMFNFLLKIKRLSQSLDNGWNVSKENFKGPLKEIEKRAKVATMLKKKSVSSYNISEYDSSCIEVVKINKRLCVLRNNVTQFIEKINEYCNFEIINKSYMKLTTGFKRQDFKDSFDIIRDENFGVKRLRNFKMDITDKSVDGLEYKTGEDSDLHVSSYNDYTLDELVDLHSSYISSITRNKLFDGSVTGRSTGLSYFEQLSNIMTVISKFSMLDDDFHRALENYIELNRESRDRRLSRDEADLNMKRMENVEKKLELLAVSFQLDINVKFESQLDGLTADLLADPSEALRHLGNVLGS